MTGPGRSPRSCSPAAVRRGSGATSSPSRSRAGPCSITPIAAALTLTAEVRRGRRARRRPGRPAGRSRRARRAGVRGPARRRRGRPRRDRCRRRARRRRRHADARAGVLRSLVGAGHRRCRRRAPRGRRAIARRCRWPSAGRSASAKASALLADGERRLRALPEALDAATVAERVWRRDDPAGAIAPRHRHAGRPALIRVPDTRRPPPEGRRSSCLGGRKREAEGGDQPR